MRWFLVLLAMLSLPACSGQADQCVTDRDCFAGEVCRTDKTCGEPIPLSEVDTGSTSTADQGTVEPDNGTVTAPDAASNAMTAADMGDPPADMTSVNEDMPGPVACIADPFGLCDDDEDPNNNDFPGAQFVPMTRGCQSSGFVPLDETISGRQCALDPEDQFYITVVECDADEPGMIIEATLDIKDDCDPDLIWFDVESIGTSCADPNPDSDKTLRCETLSDGRRRISIIWPGSSVPVVGSIRFSIQTPDRTDVQFDYDLNIVIREP